jgi:hypothetical protein
MPREGPPFLIPHSEHGAPDCPGAIWPLSHEDNAELVDFWCNDCDALMKTVAPSEVTRTIEEMRLDKGAGVAAFCNHCGQISEFPGYSEMFAFVCRHCGESVTLAQVGEQRG